MGGVLYTTVVQYEGRREGPSFFLYKHPIFYVFELCLVYYQQAVQILHQPQVIPCTRVSSKQTKINFGSNRNKPKQDLFRVCFGLFRETKNKKFRFVSLFRTYNKQPKQTELFRSKPKQTETTLNFVKNRIK
jgi:hypothetical protein